MNKIDRTFYTDNYSLIDNLDICEEECSELIKACSKMKRSMGFGLATKTSQEEARAMMVEEISHVICAIENIKIQLDIGEEEIYEESIKGIEKAKASFEEARKAEDVNG